MRAHYEDRRSVLEKQGRINTKDGQDVDIAMVYSIISSSEGHPLSAIINVRDISRLKESEDLRATFLSMIGHELQTPLSIIKGFASTLTRSDGKWNEKSIRDGLQVVEEECDHMNKLVERILLASRIEAGALTLGAVALAQMARPDLAGGAVFCDLLEEVEMRIEKER